MVHKAHLCSLLAFQSIWYCDYLDSYNAYLYYQLKMKCCLSSFQLVSPSPSFFPAFCIFLSPPLFLSFALSIRFQWYLQTIWRVTSMWPRCRSLNQNSMYCTSFWHHTHCIGTSTVCYFVPKQLHNCYVKGLPQLHFFLQLTKFLVQAVIVVLLLFIHSKISIQVL